MKKLLVALILAVILTATLATPAFADEGKGNMPGNAGDLENPLENPQGWICGLKNAMYYRLGWGHWVSYLMTGKWSNPAAYGWAAKYHSFLHITSGEPPAKPHWAGGP